MRNPEEVLEQNPGSVLFASYAEQLAHEGNDEKALEILEKGIASNPSYAFGHSVLANILFSQQDHQRAAEECQKALELDPQMSNALLVCGQYYLENNEPEKALHYLETARQFDPQNFALKGYYNKARTGSQGKDDSGISNESSETLVDTYQEEAADKELAVDDEISEPALGDEPVDVDETEVFDDLTAPTEDESFPLSEDEFASKEPPVEEEESDLDSLMESFGEEDINIEEPDEAPVDTATVESEEAPVDTAAEEPEVETETEPGFGEMLDTVEEPPAAGEETVEDPPHLSEDELASEELPAEEEEADQDSLMDSFGEEEISSEEPEEASIDTTADEAEVELETESGFGEMPDTLDEPPAAEEETVEEPQTLTEDELATEAPPAEDEEPDLDSLMESFGEDDINIEEPEEMPVDTAAEEPVVDSTSEMGEAELSEPLVEPLADEEETAIDSEVESGKDSVESFPNDDFNEDINRLMNKVDDDTGETAADEQPEESEEPVAELMDEGYADDLPDFKGIEAEDEGIEQISSGIALEGVPLHEIDEADDYDPSRVESEESDDSEPVLSDEERTELLSYEKTGEEEILTDEKSEDDKNWNSPLKDLLDVYDQGEDGSDTKEVEEVDIFSDGIYGDLSKDEIDLLSSPNGEADNKSGELEEETREGIDYSDVLTETVDGTSDFEETLFEAKPLSEEETGSDIEEESSKRLSYSDKMILDMGEVETGDDELPDFSGLSEADDVESIEDVSFATDEISIEEESGDNIPSVSESELESQYELDESVQQVEDIIRQAPNIELQVEQEDVQNIVNDVSQDGIDDLLDDYVKALQNVTVEIESVDDVVDNAIENFDSLSEADEPADENDGIKSDTETTATMAEIYVSQGLLSRGIDIYKILVDNFPENEEYTKRLAELESMAEQSTDDL